VKITDNQATGFCIAALLLFTAAAIATQCIEKRKEENELNERMALLVFPDID
jgi:hypothetical protein